MTADITSRLMLPLDSALAMLSKSVHPTTHIQTLHKIIFILSPSLTLSHSLSLIDRLPLLVKLHGVQIKACGAMLRLRLYQTLSHLSPAAYEGIPILYHAICYYSKFSSNL